MPQKKCTPTAFGFGLYSSSVTLTGLCLHEHNAFLYWKVALVNGFLHQICKWKQISVLQRAGAWPRAVALCSGCTLDGVAEDPAAFLMYRALSFRLWCCNPVAASLLLEEVGRAARLVAVPSSLVS